MRSLLVFDASLAKDPYICWLYAAQFAATAGPAAGETGFLPLFDYRGPEPRRLAMQRLRWSEPTRSRKRKSLAQRLRLSEDPAVTVTSLDEAKRGFLRILGEHQDELARVVLFGRDPVDVVELAKLAHLTCRATVPAMACVVQRRRLSEITAVGLRALGIPIYLDVGYSQAQDEPGASDGGFADVRSFWSAQEYPFAPQRGADADWARLLAPLSARPRAPVVLFLRPDWPSCGSFTTFRSIARRYAERGTVLLDIAIDESRRRYTKADAGDRLSESRSQISPAVVFAAARSRSRLTAWEVRRRGAGLVAEHVHRYARAAAPEWLRQLLQEHPPDYAYVNHYFTLDYLRRLQIDVPVLLDVHDIQAVNYIHHRHESGSRGRSELFSDLLRDELSFLSRARSIAFVSADELELAAPMLRGIDTFHFIAVPKVVPLVADAGGNGQDGRPRVLIVASRNPGNEANLDWFLHNVWPRVQATGAALDIVGTIAGYLEGRPLPEGCAVHGPAESLAGYYAGARAVALPIVTGGGVAIKTIEALLHERPVCATSHAFRGLGQAVRSRFPCLDEAVAFADDLRSLIEDPSAAQARLEACRAAAQALQPERFDAAFDLRHHALLAGDRAGAARVAARAGLATMLGVRARFGR